MSDPPQSATINSSAWGLSRMTCAVALHLREPFSSQRRSRARFALSPRRRTDECGRSRLEAGRASLRRGIVRKRAGTLKA